jgi:hypothetical protein
VLPSVRWNAGKSDRKDSLRLGLIAVGVWIFRHLPPSPPADRLFTENRVLSESAGLQ